MKCISPVTFRQKVKDGFGNESPRLITVPCGHCVACLSKRKDDWVFRLKQEFYNSTLSVFVTLTYSDDYLPHSPDNTPTLRMDDVSSFIKRLRKRCGNGIRFFGCGEYGSETNRPHYHLILFNVPNTIEQDILATWHYGNIRVDPLTEGRIAYTCKYVLGSSQLFDDVPFMSGSILMSARDQILDSVIGQPSELVTLLKREPSLLKKIALHMYGIITI